MGLDFAFTGGVEVEKIDLKKPDKDNPEYLSAEIKFTGQAERDALMKLLDCASTEISNLWDKTDNEYPRFRNIVKVELSNLYRDHYLTLARNRYESVTFKKFIYSLKQYGRLEITMIAVIDGINDLELTLLKDTLKNTSSCRLESAPDLFTEAINVGDAIEIQTVLREAIQKREEEQETLDLPEPLYDEAKKLVIREKLVSITMIQKHLKIAYNRAAHIVEKMEEDGIVSVIQKNGSRNVLMPMELE